jgi:transcriptional regulator with XRE-family HTH domain
MGAMKKRDSVFRHQIAARLDDLLDSRDLSPKDLADQIFVRKTEIEKVLAGRPSEADLLRRISEALNVTLPELVDISISLNYCSVFISYGGPDELIARKFYKFLKSKNIKCFFFPETATPGVRLHRTMSQGIHLYDRVLLLCSESSLKRQGVLNEIEQVLIKEAAEGGNELIIPLTLDDYIFNRWKPSKADIARQLRARVVADFSHAKTNQRKFAKEMQKILQSLRKNA